MAFSGAIFDLDGVLVDTAAYHYQAWKVIADELGVPFDEVKNERLRGIPRMASLGVLIEDMTSKPANLEELATRKNAIYVEMIEHISPADLLPHADTLLQALKHAGIKIGLASSSKNARPVIQRLGIEPLFDAVVDGNDVTHAKPHPEIFLTCATRLALPPDACVVLEDAPAGIDAAVAAGTYPVALIRDEPISGAKTAIRTLGDVPLSLWGINA